MRRFVVRLRVSLYMLVQQTLRIISCAQLVQAPWRAIKQAPLEQLVQIGKRPRITGVNMTPYACLYAQSSVHIHLAHQGPLEQ